LPTEQSNETFVTTTTLSLAARDGYPLAATLYEPDPAPAAPPAAALITSATAVPQGFYSRFALFLASQGIPALTFDYRGIGRSRPASLKGFAARVSDWGTRDVPAMLDALAGRYPGAELFVVGHSIGGPLLGLADNNGRVRGLVGVAAQSGDWRLWRGPRRYLLAGLWYVVMPGLTRVFGYFPGRKLALGGDLPAGVARELARWCRTRGYLAAHLGRSVPDYFGTFRGPILAYSSADDRVAPRAAVEALLRLYRHAAPVQHRHLDPKTLGLPPLGHVGFFRKESASLWPEVARWMLHAAGRAAATCPDPAACPACAPQSS
jgi:predicted alpha/beta hydrolase